MGKLVMVDDNIAVNTETGDRVMVSKPCADDNDDAISDITIAQELSKYGLAYDGTHVTATAGDVTISLASGDVNVRITSGIKAIDCDIVAPDITCTGDVGDIIVHCTGIAHLQNGDDTETGNLTLEVAEQDAHITWDGGESTIHDDDANFYDDASECVARFYSAMDECEIPTVRNVIAAFIDKIDEYNNED
jgi:hypothetical protein